MDRLDTDSTDLNSLVEDFNQRLRNVLDKHAPNKQQRVSQRPFCSWFTEDILQGKRNRRSVERALHDKPSAENLKKYKQAKNLLNRLVDNAKKEYYKRVIH